MPNIAQPLQTFGNKSLSCGWNIANNQSAVKRGGCQSKEFISCRNSTLYYPAIIIPFLLCLDLSMRYRKKILAAVWRLQPSDNSLCSLNAIDVQNICQKTIFRSEYDVISLKQRPTKWELFYLREIRGDSATTYPFLFKAIKKIMFLFLGSFKSGSIQSQHCQNYI